MTHTPAASGPLHSYLWAADKAFRAGQQVARLRERVSASQRVAADTFDRIADSHERTAAMYDAAAARSDPADADNCGHHAEQHRAFAYEDREIAARLRRMADLGGAPT